MGFPISIQFMEPDDKLAQWAALFVRAQAEDAASLARTKQDAPAVSYPGVSAAAGDLLRAVDAGGVPAFVTGNLKQIALENGIEVNPQWTPNEIVAAIRRKALAQPGS